MLHRFAAEATRVGDFDKARALTEEARSTAHRLGDRRNESFALATLADVAHHEGDIDRSIELLTRASSSPVSPGSPGGRAGGSSTSPRSVRVRPSGDAERWLETGLAVLLPLRDRQLLVYGLALAALEAERGRRSAGLLGRRRGRGAARRDRPVGKRAGAVRADGSRARRLQLEAGGRPAGCSRWRTPSSARSPRTELAAIVASLTPRATRRCNPSRRLAADESEEGSNWIRTAETTSRTCHHRASGRSGSPSASPVSS